MLKSTLTVILSESPCKDGRGAAGPPHPPDRFGEGVAPPEISRQKMFPIC